MLTGTWNAILAGGFSGGVFDVGIKAMMRSRHAGWGNARKLLSRALPRNASIFVEKSSVRAILRKRCQLNNDACSLFNRSRGLIGA